MTNATPMGPTATRIPAEPTAGAAAATTAGTATAEPPTGRVIARLLRLASPLNGRMASACLFGTIGHLAAAFLPVSGVFAMFAAAGHPIAGIGVAPAITALVIFAIIRGLMRYAEQYTNHYVAFTLLALLRDKAFGAMRRLAPAKLEGRGRGDLIALVTTDVELLEIFFAHTISPTVIATATSLIMALALLPLSPALALLLVVAHLLVGVALPWLQSLVMGPLGGRIRGQASALDDYVIDGLRGIGETMGFGRGDAQVREVEERTNRLYDERAKLSHLEGMFAAFAGVIVVLASAAAALIVAQGAAVSVPAVTHGPTIDAAAAPPSLVDVAALGPALAGAVLVASSFGPTLALANLPANLTQTFAAARRLFAIMDETPAVEETGTATPAFDGMALEHVDFAYPEADGPETDGGAASGAASAIPAHVLHDANLTVPAHGILGIQGPSGRGKSTMLKLLQRFWDPTAGRVTFSGEDLRDVSAAHRRAQQVVVRQETHLFDGTIGDNLRIADPAATEAELDEACRKASVLDLIRDLPKGYDTPIGELGDRLSQGERQRLGLARAFLRHAPLMLLDEPTSRLDALNEAVILRAVRAAARDAGTSVVLVSHRESTMRIADHVVRL